jgi:hypothetical protein
MYPIYALLQKSPAWLLFLQYYHFFSCDIFLSLVFLLLHADVNALTTRVSEMLSLKQLLLRVVAGVVFN